MPMTRNSTIKSLILALWASASLVACGADSAANAESSASTGTAGQVAANSPPSVPAAEKAAIMKAAGFTRPQGDDKWVYSEGECDSVWADIDEHRDINGDGSPDAIVISEGDQCYGMNQRSVTLLTRQGSTWTVLTQFQDYFAAYSFHPRNGISWPDIEIWGGMEENPGCRDFVRWTGSEYTLGGTSDEGKICSLDPQFHSTSVAASRGAAEPGTSVPFPPIQKGFYAINMSCRDVLNDNFDLLTYIDDKKWVAFDGGASVLGFDALGGNRYRVRMDGDAVTIALDGQGGFVREEDEVTHAFCPTDQIPADVRQDILSAM